jgi:hypothetical protein
MCSSDRLRSAGIAPPLISPLGGAPRIVRGRPSGLKAAAHRLRRRPWRAGPDPRASAAPDRQATRAGQSLPPNASRTRAYSEYQTRANCQQRCNDPMNLADRSHW